MKEADTRAPMHPLIDQSSEEWPESVCISTRAIEPVQLLETSVHEQLPRIYLERLSIHVLPTKVASVLFYSEEV